MIRALQQISTLCRWHSQRLPGQQMKDGITQRMCQIQTTACKEVFDKDHPGKKAADKHQSQIQKEELQLDNEMDSQLQELGSIFPNEETPSMIINGVRFDELPVVHIKSTHNNTIITVTDSKGVPMALESGDIDPFNYLLAAKHPDRISVNLQFMNAFKNLNISPVLGTVGFRNARKGTNIAAQAAAIAVAEKAVKKGVSLARICVSGIGPGRLPAVKGLQMSGITVVSITDTTPLPHNGNRPKKQRRL